MSPSPNCFSAKPDILLLDEPTNHLDAESVAWLERYLKEYTGCVILVTHDRYFLDNITEWTLELDRGQGVPYKGNYSSWLEQKAKRQEVEKSQDDSRSKALSRELEWIRSSPKARQAKSKARVAAYDKLVEQSTRDEVGKAQIQIATGPKLGGIVVEVDNLGKAFGDRLLIDGLSFKLPPGGIVGVIGPNGAGKTTLFKMITGQEQPDKGTIRLGETVKVSYVDQSRGHLEDKKTVWEEISGGVDQILLGGKKEVPSRAYCGWFNFKGADQQKKVGQLSGGERNRVHLAKLLKEGGNLLLLDEPTNDLDTETLGALESALEDFPGCAVVISHDRFFLDRLATHILAFEGDSHVEWFEGNFADYEEDKKKRLGDQAVEPPPHQVQALRPVGWSQAVGDRRHHNDLNRSPVVLRYLLALHSGEFMGQLIGARLRLGAWAASTSSVIALLASGVSLWETVLKQPSLKVHIGETFSYTRDPWGSYEVFAVPVTIMNSGARDGAVMSLRLDLTNTDTGQKETFESAYTADSGWFSGADNVTTRTRRPKMQFSPLSINGRSAWSGTILFYSPEAREKKLAEPKSQVTGVLSINASMPGRVVGKSARDDDQR